MGRQLSLHVVGVTFPNKDGGNRRFEILLCAPGEPVSLVLEPKNSADPNAVAVFSMRDVQIGYLSADRAAWIGGLIREDIEVQAIFQETTHIGAAIRVGLHGELLTLPPRKPAEINVPPRAVSHRAESRGFPCTEFSDSGCVLVLEAGTEGTSIVSGSSRPGGGGDLGWFVA
jgi:hypothetical protein